MRVLIYYTCLFITMSLLIGCVSAPRFTFAKYQGGSGEGTYSIYEEGVASYYADEFHGRTTSNGETFDMNQLTAAHRTLPFNTKVLVTNTLNGKTVTVRINDRGPFVDDRIIDLSLAAARAIDLVGPGTAKVKLQVVELGSTERPIKP